MTQPIFNGSNGSNYEMLDKLAQGGQGSVLKVKDKNGNSFALKWYHHYMADGAQRQQLTELVKRKPQCDNADIDFIWPIEMVTWAGQNSYGYVMPLYDSNHYVHFNRIINGKLKQPSVDKLAKLSYLICVALSAIHKDGYAYCDINLGNIQFDVQNGKILVCDNDNVIVNNSNAQVVGVPEFMSPEVALGTDKPSAQSDLYSIAILLYQLWMWEHPMDGALTEKVRCWDQPAKIKHYAKEPLFVHHPTDRRNGAEQSSVLSLSLKRWNTTCPDSLKALFIRAFVDGVHEPSKRPRLSEWQKCFLEIQANSIACAKCGAVNGVDLKQSVQNCFHCQQVLPVGLVLKINQVRSNLVVKVGAELRQHHLNAQSQGDEALTVLGVIEAHPKQAGAFILRNKTEEPWFYDADGQQFKIEPNQARPLVVGGKVKMGSAEVEVVMVGEQ